MYGLIHTALQKMIVSEHGPEVWGHIMSAADVREDVLLTMRSYDDQVTYALVSATAEVLEAPADACLELFGRFWVKDFAPQDYGMLLDRTGESLIDFLEHLDDLHDHISTVFSDFKPPSFQVERVDEKCLHVHYRSSREGLSAFVVGLLHGLTERFAVEASVETYQHKQVASGEHTIFELRMV